MKLLAYIKRLSQEERAVFAVKVGTTLGHLLNVAYVQRVPSAALTRQIALETEGAVPEWELRPQDWHLIWTELHGAKGAPLVPAPEFSSAH